MPAGDSMGQATSMGLGPLPRGLGREAWCPLGVRPRAQGPSSPLLTG